jgi:hypothetical protein
MVTTVLLLIGLALLIAIGVFAWEVHAEFSDHIDSWNEFISERHEPLARRCAALTELVGAAYDRMDDAHIPVTDDTVSIDVLTDAGLVEEPTGRHSYRG